jgi:membrane-associated phospholipid phosphatase
MILGAKGSKARRTLAGMLAFSILAVVFRELVRLDLPFARFVRSLHVLWLERLGDTAGMIGSGAALVTLSAVLLAVGYLYRRPVMRRAGLYSLVAHGISAVLAQLLKHGIGRPRPRLMHADAGFGWHPSFQTGLDSFPSGHASASFALATVLARYFPAFGVMAYGAAGLIAVSRVVRGSHYPTDVLGGICLGVLVGHLVVRPWREWAGGIRGVLLLLVPYGLAVFGVVTCLVHFPPADGPTISMMTGGGGLVTAGIAMRVYVTACGGDSRRLQPTAGRLIVVGLAAVTSSWALTTLTAALCLVHDFEAQADSNHRTVSSSPTVTALSLVPMPVLAAVFPFDGHVASL